LALPKRLHPARRKETAMPHIVSRKNLYAPRPRPIAEMNVTPFIDVLLVLLIMVILASPQPMNVTPVDLPGDDRSPHRSLSLSATPSASTQPTA
jgi:biopolymer transport protein ExbD